MSRNTVFAVVEIAGKQYRVSPGDRIAVERLEAEPGSEITLDSVLDHIRPTLALPSVPRWLPGPMCARRW